MTAEEKHWQDIWAYQAREIETLAADAGRALKAGRRRHYSEIAKWLGPDIGGRALEIGCGPGRYVALLASLGYDVVGADPHSNAAWELVSKHRKVEFRQPVFAETLPFADGEFDHLACLGAMLYFKDPNAALAEMRRVTKLGARAIFRTVNDRHLYTRVTGKRLDPLAPNYYSSKSFGATLEQAGFAVQRQFSYGFFPPFGTKKWWWLVNGQMPIAAQEVISNLTPANLRVNLVAFAIRK